MQRHSQQSAIEQRLIYRGVLGNTANVVGGSFQEHVVQPALDGNPVKAALGLPIAAFDIVTTAPDAALAGLVGQDIERLPAQTGARTRRDLGITLNKILALPGDLLALNLGAAAKDVALGALSAVRLIGDVPADGLDALGGYDVVDRRRAQARGSFNEVLAI